MQALNEADFQFLLGLKSEALRRVRRASAAARKATLRHLLSLMFRQPVEHSHIKLTARDFTCPGRASSACPFRGVIPRGIAGEIIRAHPFANQGDSSSQL